ncbi:hypothetical protein J5690_08290 [bacterium]|nr:hypothetical protein [bacterium]
MKIDSGALRDYIRPLPIRTRVSINERIVAKNVLLSMASSNIKKQTCRRITPTSLI